MNNRKVLIVDDDPIIRDLLATMVDSIGRYETSVAVDGLDGMGKVQGEVFDIVFTDIKMPRMGGLEFLRELKKYSPRTPVVVITAYAYLETAIAAMKEGAADFITKPFRANDIKFILDRINNDLIFLNSLGDTAQGNSTDPASNALYERLRDISLMHTIFSSLDELGDNRTLFENSVEFASKLLKSKESALGIIEDDILNIIYSRGISAQKIPLNGVFSEIIKGRKHRVLDVGNINPLTSSILSSQMLLLPLILNNDVYGFLTIGVKADGYSFTDEEVSLALSFVKKLSLKIENNALYEIFHGNLMNTINSLVTTIEARDSYTKIHSERVTAISIAIGKTMGLKFDELETIRFGGYLHDVGKIGVRDTVLLKPTVLTRDELSEIRLHPIIGENIIRPLGSFQNELLLIRHHHERYDGKGYPDGLGSTDIPLSARIIAVSDTYDSITSSRPYRKAQTIEAAVQEIRRCSGTQFDPLIVDAFLATKYAQESAEDAVDQE